ncbi:hypothetical protein FBPa24_0039 [Pseudomonas phage vB_PaeM_FBPa24]|nr:hypothetical protein FBPa24_0039 [Pseudomonas phage vB_PaeM_FBPa24]
MASFDFSDLTAGGDQTTSSTDWITLEMACEAEFRAALGANINLAASTPQGSLVAAEAIARSSVMRNEARIANTINPNVSFGTFLDAICALMGIERGSDLSTFGYGVQVTGRSQTRISTGSSESHRLHSRRSGQPPNERCRVEECPR